jgi:hypothetical protein
VRGESKARPSVAGDAAIKPRRQTIFRYTNKGAAGLGNDTNTIVAGLTIPPISEFVRRKLSVAIKDDLPLRLGACWAARGCAQWETGGNGGALPLHAFDPNVPAQQMHALAHA